MITVNLHQAQQIVETFGGEDSFVSLDYFDAWVDAETKEQMTAGLYAWFEEYPDEGRIYIPESADSGGADA